MFWNLIKVNKRRVIIILTFIAAIIVGGVNAKADFIFGEPTNLGPIVNSPATDACVNISVDGLSLIFGSSRSGTSGLTDIWVATRATTEENWGTPVLLANVNSSAEESWLNISADGLSLYFCDMFMGHQPRPGGHGQGDIWVSTRATVSDTWGLPENLGPSINTSNYEICPFIWNGGCTLLFSSDRPGGYGRFDLWMTTRETMSDEWDTPVPLENVNSSSENEFGPAMSPDGLLLFFLRGTSVDADMWMASRKSVEEPFGFPVKVPEPINYLSFIDSTPSFSADGSILYFCSNRPGGSGDYDMWQAPLLPVVDFNFDGIVDTDDLIFMIEHWGTDEPSCDIGPMPWGDGFVDSQDLQVLMDYWGQIDLVVDDFEDYKNNPPDQIFSTWIDGYDVETNGSTIGYLNPDIDAGENFVETDIVHGGSQAMPFFYDNNGTANYSEAERTFNPAQDWTRGGAEVLSLWFRGHPVYIGGFEEGPDRTYTVSAGGSDIWDNSDEFHFAWKQVSVAASIIAKIESVENVHEWSKAGVMIRDTLEPESRHAMVAITPSNGVWFGHRDIEGGSSVSIKEADITAPQWVKLERSVDCLVRACYSANGTTWTEFDSVKVMMNAPMYIGLGVTSHKSGVACEAKFSNVSFPVTIVEPQWTNQDIGIISNEAAPMYLTIADDYGSTAIVYHDNPNAALLDSWTEWNINLRTFVDQGVNLTNVNSIAIGFGDKDNPQHGSSGLVYFDDIKLIEEK